MKTQKKYEAPQTQHAEVELEQGFMKASTFEPGDETTQQGLSIEEHGFANPGVEWEGDYTGTVEQGGGWDK